MGDGGGANSNSADRSFARLCRIDLPRDQSLADAFLRHPAVGKFSGSGGDVSAGDGAGFRSAFEAFVAKLQESIFTKLHFGRERFGPIFTQGKNFTH
jgi:hypothetical protein